MNERELLIYFFPSNGDGWRDATTDIVWYRDNGNCWKVKFKDMNRYYPISFHNMKVFDKPKEIDFAVLYYRGSPCFGVASLLCFNNTIYKIFYINGYTRVALPSDIKIVKDVLQDNTRAQGIMAYYRRVVQETIKTEDDSFLLSQFDNIDYVPDESVLALYLEGKLGKSEGKLGHPVISPFGTNLSQSKALKMMFSNRISIVEGPPGTGKTQTILNFISNALINKKSVAVVSNNNSATDNVYEKLQKYGYSFVAAPLGNADNVDQFFEEYNSEIPSFSKKKIDVHSLVNLYLALPDYFENENNKRKAIEKLNDFEVEYNHFLTDNKDIDFSKIKYNPSKVKSSDVLYAIVKFKETTKKLSFLSWLNLRFKLKINKSFFNLSKDDYIVYLNNLYYLTRIDETKKLINELGKRMNNQSLDEKVNNYVRLSRTYFENQLSEMFADNTRKAYERDNYKRQFDDFIKDYPVILSSTYSLAKCSRRGFLFDYLIIDESSQVNMASAILSMRVAKNIVVVGDIKQLPQIDDDSFKKRNSELLNQFKVPFTYSYYGNSIMSSLIALYGDKVPRTLLKEHYRCSPDIISFCNKRFYEDELIVYTTHSNNDYSMKVIKTVEGNFARKNPNGSGLYNQREIDEIIELIKNDNLKDVGVIAPYRYQTEVLSKQLDSNVEASTIHKFQGREKKTIIFSSVVNDSNDFVGNDNLVNVAVSRAIDKFILVTSDKVAKSNSGVLSDLVNYITYHNNYGSLQEGTVRSIYDLLYEDYQEQLALFRSKHHSKDYDSENLTKELLRKILSLKEYKSFWFKMHVSLKDFIDSKGMRFTDDEYRFYRNPNAHADFLIYNKMSRKPLLVIEVDGVSFHEQQKEQLQRDAVKNSILDKAHIKILRLKTNESNEEERIKNALASIML